jgi:hypothetical protein
MASFIIDEPFDVCWSRNPIRYGIHSGFAQTVSGLTIEVKLIFRKESESFNDIITQTFSPDSDGNIFVDFSFILDSLLTYQLPDLNISLPEQVLTQKGYYYIEYREISSLDGNPPWNSTIDKIRIILKGGLSIESWSADKFFSEYLPNEKKFLSWQESGYMATVKERLYLHYFSVMSTSSQAYVIILIHFSDSSEQTISIPVGSASGIEKFSLFLIPTGIEQLQLHLLASDRIIQWWEVSIKLGEAVLAGPFKYVCDYRYYKDEVQFIYFNSLGGCDNIRIRGNWETQHTRDIAEVERVVNPFYGNSNELPAMVDDSIFKERITWKGNAGYMSRQQQDRYRELLLSRKRVTVFRGRWINARILNKSTSLFNTVDQLINLPMEWALGYDNINYTPADANFGNLNIPVSSPNSLRIEGVRYNVHTLVWNTENATAFLIKGYFYDEVSGSLINSNPVAFSRTTKENSLDLDLGNYRHARCRVFAYKNGYISGASVEITFPVVDVSVCPIVTNIHVIGWSNNAVNIGWNGAESHFTYEVIGTLTNNSDTGLLAPSVGWVTFTSLVSNSVTIDINTFRSIQISVRAICVGTESPIVNSAVINKP